MNGGMLLGLIALLSLSACFVYLRPNIALARGVALLTLALSLMVTLRSLLGSAITDPNELLSTDELSALFMPLTSLVACAVLFASPVRDLSGATLSSVLLALASAIVAYCARDLTVFTVAWSLRLFASGLALPRGQKRFATAYKTYATLGTLPLIVALVILYRAHDTSFAPASAARNALSVNTQHLVFFLLALAAAFRSGLLPLHSWLPAITARTPVSTSAMIFGAQLGPLLLARAIVPLTPHVAQGDLSPFALWAVVSALYAGLLGLVQTDLKRTLGFVLTSQSALLLFGVSGSDPESMHGALLGIFALGLTGTGLLLIAGAIEERTGTTDLVKLRGRGLAFPRMTALFFLFSVASIGVPGTLPFVSEDLLLHGLLHVNPLGAMTLLLAAVLNGITLLKTFFQVFQGPTRERKTERRGDLTTREAAIIAGLLSAVVLAGLSPRILLALQDHSVRALEAGEVSRLGAH